MTLACTGTIDGNDSGAAGVPAVPANADGELDLDGDGLPDLTGVVCGDAVGAAPAPLRRMTRTEYNNTVFDLLGDDSAPAAEFPQDEAIGGFESNNRSPVTSLNLEQYMTAAESVAQRAAPSFTCAGSEEACVQEFITTFGRRAYRRPLSAEEAAAYTQMFQDKRARADYGGSIQLLIQAMLQSPHFLYRPEVAALGTPSGSVVALSDYEIASRLSYFAWGSTPDDELLDAASRGQLGQSEGLQLQAARLFEDARAARGVRSLYGQWLSTGQLATADKDPVLYPMFDEALAAAMQQETLLFVEDLFSSPQPLLGTLLTADYTFANPVLATLYGVTLEGAPNEFSRISLPPGQRSGVLTHAGFLSVTSHATEGSPILRGKFIRQRLLCQAIPDPPSDLEITPPEIDPDATTQERFNQHRDNPACAGCHNLMDPLGFGFIRYDAIGQWQETDGNQPVDDRGELTGSDVDGDFRGALELAQRLTSSTTAQRCVAANAVRFALGRPETETESCAVDYVAQRFAESGLDLRDLMLAVVTSDAFRFRIVE